MTMAMVNILFTIVMTGAVIAGALYAIHLNNRINELEDDFDRVFEAFQLGAKPSPGPGKHLRNGGSDV